MKQRSGRAPTAAALALLLVGCGYSTGIRAKEHMRSVGVAIFGNTTLERDLERPLQDEITRAVRSLTDVPLSSPETAPVILRGKITDFHRRAGIRSTHNEVLETGVFLEIEASLVDRTTDRVMGPPRKASVWIGFVTDDPNGEGDARTRAFRHVAEEIVLDLFSPLD